MRTILLLLLMTIIPFTIFTSCAGGSKLSPGEILAFSGREQLPTQEEYPDDGAVILYENFKDQLFLNSDWNVKVKETRHRAILYFNDKAEDWTTFSIYLDPEVKLTDFYARTIKPNGESIELEKKDLHPTQLKADFVAFSDDHSVKFTFAGVEPGSIVEYNYTVVRSESFYGGDLWPIQAAIPKLYSRFAVEFDFSKKNFASATGRLLIFKPSIFQTVSKLDRYRDINRKFPVVYFAPYKISDEMEIHFPCDHFEVEAIAKSIADRESFAVFSSHSTIEDPGLLTYKKMYVLKHCTIPAGQYDLFRKVQKTIATANNENIVLRKKM